MSEKKMTRQEHIDRAVVGVSTEYMLPINKWQYQGLYGDRIGKPVDEYSDFAEMGFTVYPTWEEIVIKQKPWLESEETMAEWFKPVVLTDEDRARIAEERAKYPTMATAYVPFGEKHSFMVPAFRYSDGRVSRAMMTNPEWEALPEEWRKELSIPIERQDERESDVLLDADEVG